MKVQRLDHIHLFSRDPEAAIAFYRRSFDAVEVSRDVDDDGGLFVLLALGGHILAVSPFPPDISPADPPPPGDGAYASGFGVAHFGLRVDDVDAAVRELREAGESIVAGPVHSPDLVVAYVAAPDGVMIELTQYESA